MKPKKISYKMGVIFSIVTLIITAAVAIQQALAEDAKAADVRALELARNPIIPPEYFQLDKRKKLVLKGPYTVEAIRYSISRDVLPAGYSEEQLINVGFEKEIKDYRDRREKRRKNTIVDLKKNLIEIKKRITANLPDLSVEDRKAVMESGILDKKKKEKLLIYLDEWIEDADNDRLSIKTLQNIQDIAKARIGMFEDTIGFNLNKKALEKTLSEARDSTHNKILKVLNRNLGLKYR